MALKDSSALDDKDSSEEVPSDTTRIDLSETEEGDGAEEQRAADDSIPAAGERGRDDKGKWTKNKNERGRQKREQVDWQAERTRLESDFRRQMSEYQSQLAEMRGRLEQATAQRPPGGQQADPIANELATVDRDMANELKLLESNEKYSPERYMRLQERKAELIATRTFQRLQAQQRPQQQQQGPNQQYAARREMLAADHPWINDPNMGELRQRAWAIREYLIGAERKPDTVDTDREALSRAVAQFGAQYGLRPPARPSRRTQQLYQGPSFGDNGRDPSGFDDDTMDVPNTLLRGTGLNGDTLRGALREVAREQRGGGRR